MKAIIIPLFIAFCFLPERLSAQWISQNSGSTATLTDVVMLDSATAIVVGTDQTILKTTDSGNTWNYIPLPWSIPMNWNCISFYDKQNGILVGKNVILTTNNGGDTWEYRLHSNTKNFLSAICIGPTSYYVGDDSGNVHQSLDTGATWTSEKISSWSIRTLFRWRGPLLPGAPLYYALTRFSICSKYIIPPPSWFEKRISQFNALGSEGYGAEYCNGGETVFIVGVQGDLRSSPVVLRKRIVDTSWSRVSQVNLKDGIFLGVSAPSEYAIYVCGTGGMIYQSTNTGETWKDISVVSTVNLHAINFYDNRHGITVGDSGKIYFTSNGGYVIDSKKTDDFIPTKFELYQNYPNPFNPSTTISFNLPSNEFASLKVYNLLGNEIESLVNEETSAGKHSFQWNASSVASGMYVYRLQAGKYTETKKCIVIR